MKSNFFCLSFGQNDCGIAFEISFLKKRSEFCLSEDAQRNVQSSSEPSRVISKKLITSGTETFDMDSILDFNDETSAGQSRR